MPLYIEYFRYFLKLKDLDKKKKKNMSVMSLSHVTMALLVLKIFGRIKKKKSLKNLVYNTRAKFLEMF